MGLKEPRERSSKPKGLSENGHECRTLVDKRSALINRIAPGFFLIETLRFEMKVLLAYIPRGWIIGGDFFPLTARRTLTFR